MQQGNESIKAFIKELKNRIDVLNSTKVTENIDNANIDKINAILSKYAIDASHDLTLLDIQNIKPTDIKKILSLTGQNVDSIEYLFTNLTDNYEKIQHLINRYINDFITIGKNQSQLISDKIALYQKYIDLFSNSTLEEPFKELNELCKVISEIGLPDEDKWKILEIIATRNNATVDDEYINLTAKVKASLESVSTYLEDEKINNKIAATLAKMEIDPDSLYSAATMLIQSVDIPMEVAINIITANVANSLLNKLKNSASSEEKEELAEEIENVLSYTIELYDPIVYEALSIKRATETFYKNSLLAGVTEEKIKEYLETPLSLIESESITREYAIDLKELSVLQPIYDTLATIFKLPRTGEEKIKATNVLRKLVEQYNLLEEKKQILKKK